ncbi:phytanoyl-CoA dioxygenase family protein [Pedococcus sp. 5OH_020]|uniref:phytanoyl-CoA dioxygenase family protein n=1 Tax=Pedococcus sp. 5OH_020 TaxID=2989814 RepID=UPI0022E9F61E|nr:phytanoyl-CoA dioxygenase family protein [Pedococcus sp. 5OH_020]
MTVTVASPLRDELFRNGYVVVPDVIDPTTVIKPVLEEYARVLDELAADLAAQGQISSTYAHLPFEARLIQIAKESGSTHTQHFDVTLPQNNIRADTPIHLGDAVFKLLTCPSVLDIVEQILGPEISVNPVQHVRLKLPAHALGDDPDPMMGKSPWHQDGAVVLEEADETEILTVWIPLGEANEENGCMRVIPTDRSAELANHCPSPVKGAHIPDAQVDQAAGVTLPMSAGSILLLHTRTVHDSLPNRTADRLRVSLDLRYQPTGQPSGREQFPSFVVRSETYPERVTTEPTDWRNGWLEARSRLAQDEVPTFNRWDPNSPLCA